MSLETVPHVGKFGKNMSSPLGNTIFAPPCNSISLSEYTHKHAETTPLHSASPTRGDMKTEPLNLATAAENFDIDPSLTDDDQGLYLPMDDNGAIPSHADIDDATATAITASLAEASQHIFAPAAGDEYTPITDPIIHAAPFIRPNRDEHTPYPEHLVFPARERFEIWLSGESSWCHYVQRRTTTPEKRAEERMRARLKAHERALAGESYNSPAFVPFGS